MTKPNYYCCASRGGARSPDEPNARPKEYIDQRGHLLDQFHQDDTGTTTTDTNGQAPGAENEVSIAIPDESSNVLENIFDTPKSKLTSRMRKRLSFGQHTSGARVLIKTPRKQLPRLRKSRIFGTYHDSSSTDLGLDDGRTPSRGGYDHDARLISEQQLLDGILVSGSNSVADPHLREETCQTGVTQDSSGNATLSSGDLSRTTPGATSSSTPNSEGQIHSSDESQSSMSAWSNESGEVNGTSQGDHCIRLPQVPRLELRSFSGSDLSLTFSSTSSNVIPSHEALHTSQAAVASIFPPNRSSQSSGGGEVLWDAAAMNPSEQDNRSQDGSPGDNPTEDALAELHSHVEQPDLLDASPLGPSSVKSMHLRDMRISQHLRSFSSLSKDSCVTSSEARDTRQTSNESQPSSDFDFPKLPHDGGFRSRMVPHSWGTVLTNVNDNSSQGCAQTPASLIASFDDTSTEGVSPMVEPASAVDAAQAFQHSQDSQLGYAMKLSAGIHSPEMGETPEVLPENRSPVLSLAVTQPRGAEEAKVEQSDENDGSARRRSFGYLLERSKLFGHMPRLRLKVGNRTTKVSLDGANGSPTELAHSDVEKQPATVGSNFGAAADIWENALNAHRSQAIGDGKSPSRASHRMSFSVIKRDPRAGAIVPSGHTIAQRKVRKESIGLKHLDIEHSFDRLAVPDIPRLVRARRLSAVHEAKLKGRLSTHQRKRSHSQPTPVARDRGRQRARRFDSLLSDESPEVKMTKEGANALPLEWRSTSVASAWTRYPSHTRAARSLSAGVSDGVNTRDFAPSLVLSDGDSLVDPTEKTPRQKRTSALMRKARIRRTLLTDLPSLLKPLSTGFRKGESGHRTSVALGGALEYPELELLPTCEADMISAAKCDMPDPAATAPNPSRAIDIEPRRGSDSLRRDGIRAKKQRLVSATASSSYPTVDRDYNPLDAYSGSNTSETRQHLSASDWSRVYGRLVMDIGRDSDFRKKRDRATDGANDMKHSTPNLTSTTSMPSLTQTRTVAFDQVLRSKLTKSCSVDPMRLSTQNLLEMLDRGLDADIARALKAADDAWKTSSEAS